MARSQRQRDRRFRTGRAYTVHGVRWQRFANFAKRQMKWTTRVPHAVVIVRDKFGRYFLSCEEHNLFATTRRLDCAFRTAAVHKGYILK